MRERLVYVLLRLGPEDVYLRALELSGTEANIAFNTNTRANMYINGVLNLDLVVQEAESSAFKCYCLNNQC